MIKENGIADEQVECFAIMLTKIEGAHLGNAVG
jgi:hypothetical protein